MKSRTKIALVTVFAALALSVAVASASAAEWKVNGTVLKGSAALATTARVDTDAVLKIVAPGQTVRVLCKGGILSGAKPEINATNKGMAESLTFEGCETVEPATKCVLEGQPVKIKTEPITAEAKAGTKGDDKVLFTPLTKKAFATLPFSEHNTCFLNESEPVNGAVTIDAPFGQTESFAQAIEGQGSSENNSLEVAGDKSFIEGGRALLQLASGTKWSFS